MDIQSLQKEWQESSEAQRREDDIFWESLGIDAQLSAFRAVCRRIHKGDVKDRGSYRYVLYDVFGFGMEAYVDGMDCGYMDIHNLIYQGIETSATSSILRYVSNDLDC